MDQSMNTAQPDMGGMSNGTTQKKQENIKIMLLGFAALVVVAVVLSAVFAVYRVYAKTGTDSFTLAVAKALHLPALKVNGVPVSYAEYAADLKAISKFREYSKANNGAGAELTDEQMSDQVLMRMVNNILVEQAAAKFGIKVEQSEVDALKTQALQQYKTTAEIDQELMKRYGWDLKIYEAKVMRPYLLQSKLAEKIQADPAAREEIRVRAQGVLDQIKNNGDFAKLAEQYGEDGTAAKGGDLGYFAKGEMVPQFESAAFALKNGEISKELVESPYGYHIIKTEDHKMEKVKDVDGKMVNKETVRARHILFQFPSVDKYLDKSLKSASMHLYLRVHNPFTDLLKK